MMRTILIGIMICSMMAARPAYAVEQRAGVSVDFGESPLFVLSNLAPGAKVTRTIKILNEADSPRMIRFRGIRQRETNHLAEAMTITIRNSSMGTRTVDQFLQDSQHEVASLQVPIAPRSRQEFTIEITFDKNASNRYQHAILIMDIHIDAADGIPEQCRGIHFSGNPIYGTNHADVLRGTSGNDLIMPLEGNDMIDGRGGDDCIVGGKGHKIVFGGTGNDVILGGRDSDYLNGESGNDYIDGGAGFDVVIGGSGRDTCRGYMKIRCEQ